MKAITSLRAWLHRSVKEARMQARIRNTTRLLHGDPSPGLGPEDVCVLSVVKNFCTFADAFFEHYDRLGVAHYVFLDNGSDDGTVERIKRHPRTTLLQNFLPFQEYDTPMRRFLLGRHARRNWALQVDADEFFDYPGSSRRSLAELVGYLDSHGYNAVPAQMLDLFPDRPVSEVAPFRNGEHCYYDLSAIERAPRPPGSVVPEGFDAPWLLGGVRALHFGVRPLLTKQPLLTNYGPVRYPNMHRISNARLADFHAVLMHYKFACDLRAHSRRAVEEKSHWNNSAEYLGYLNALDGDPHLNLRTSTSRRLVSADELAGPEFLPVGAAFAAWAGLDLPVAHTA